MLAMSSPVHAVEPSEILSDPALESRARELSKGLRCLVCRNENIDESDADLAKDLRILVRERLVAGDTDQEILDYAQSRYGDYVLLKPPLNAKTILLWFGGPILLIGGGIVAWRQIATRPVPPTKVPPLTEAERARLRDLGIEADREA